MVKISLFVLTCLSGLIVHAQVYTPYTTYTTEDGLPSNHVYDIRQDSEGYMWFATNRGLAKFDGSNFKIFTSKEGLPNNDIWILETDTSGRVWYFSNSNFQGYIKNDSVYRFPIENDQAINPRFSYRTKNGFLLHSSQGIYCLENDSLVIHFSEDEIIEQVRILQKKYGDETSFSLWPTRKEIYFIGKRDKEIFIVNTNFDTVLIQSIKADSRRNWQKDFFRIGILHNQIFFHVSINGLLLIDKKNKRARYYSFSTFFCPDEIEIFFCISTATEIQLSVSGYLMIFNHQLELTELITLPQDLHDIHDIKNFKDRDGNIWISGLGNGATIIPQVRLKSEVYFPLQKVEAIGRIDGHLFAGVFSKGFYEFNTSGELGVQLLFSENFHRVYAVKNDPKNQTDYLISMGETFEIKAGEILRVSVENEYNDEIGLSFKDIAQLKNHKYVADYSGIVKYSLQTNKFICKYMKLGILQLVEYEDKIFVGASDGLFILDQDTIISAPATNSSLRAPINYMRAFGKYLIIGTNGRGLYIYHRQRLLHIKSTDGLMVQKFCIDEGNLWMATHVGIKKVVLNKKNPENSPIKDAFYKSDGLIQNNINDLCLQDGIIYAATDNGISKIDPNNSIYKKKPDLRFNITEDTLTVSPTKNGFTSISFFVLDYVNQRHFKYWYRLRPHQNEWEETITKTLNFSSLAPDLYALEVKVSDQHENSAIKTLYINVLPTWWETKTSKICFSILTIGMLIFIYSVIVFIVRKKEAQKSQLKKDMASLELQSLRSQMNPHFVHNSLNSIQYFIQKNDVKQSENYLTKFSKLIRLFFDYSRMEHITICDEIDLIRNYLAIEHLRFENKLSYEIIVDSRLDIDDRIMPTMILQPIVENAVNHGVFHLAGDGKVIVNFSFVSPSIFRVTIEDNGVGIDVARQKETNSNKNGFSRSSEVLKDRLKLLKESKEWEVIHTISNFRKDEKLSGTKVELHFNHI